MSILRTPASMNGDDTPCSGPAAMPGRSSDRSSTISPLTIRPIETRETAEYIAFLQM